MHFARLQAIRTPGDRLIEVESKAAHARFGAKSFGSLAARPPYGTTRGRPVTTFR